MDTNNLLLSNRASITGKDISQALISLFERRYFSNFEVEKWNIDSVIDKQSGIVLKKITEIGRIQERDDIRAVLPNILHACHSEGHALVMMLNGLGTHQEVYLGGRRILGKANSSTTGYINGVESAFKTYYGGLKMSKAERLVSIPHVYDFIATAPVMTAITGIPSNKEAAKTFNIQSLDRLARAAGNYKYAMMAIAEPINAVEVDKIVDQLRDLKSEIHSLKITNLSEQKGSSSSTSVSKQDVDFKKQIPYQALATLGRALTFVGMTNPLVALGGGTLQMIGQGQLAKLQSEVATISSQSSTSETISISTVQLNAHAEFCEKLIDEHLNRLLNAKSNGWWQLGVYVVAENEETLGGIVGAIKSICSGDNSTLDPIRALDIPNAILRKHILEGSIIKAKPLSKQEISHPLGTHYNSFATCVNSKELSTVIHLPINEIPGIRFINHADFSQNPPKKIDILASIDLGNIEKNGDELLDIKLGLKSLNRHLFISGMTGGGKSNTCLQILYELFQKHKIPFMVIDPVKSDYTQLLTVPELKKDLKVFSIGVSSDLPLRINPFELLSWDVCRGNKKFLSKHIEYLKAIFTASLPDLKSGPSISIIEDALTLVYKSKGWNINFSSNKWLKEDIKPSDEDWYSIMPNMEDFWSALQIVIDEKQYKSDTQKDVREALLTRFSSLTAVNKGAIFNCSRSVNFKLLFDNPSIIEIKDLADDDDKSIVMAIVFTFLYEYSEYVRGESNNLKHVTIIEEAHRLLSAPKFNQDAGNPHLKLVETFSQMIAEMRGFGEGFIIADQSPQALSSSTIRNTNIKIIHRLTDKMDRSICGGSINLNEEQINYLNNLEPGYAVVHDDTFEEPVLIKVKNFKDTKIESGNINTKAQSLKLMADSLKNEPFLLRKNACKGCTSPCKFYYESDFEDMRQEIKKGAIIADNEGYAFVKKWATFVLFEQFNLAHECIISWQKNNSESTDILFCKGVYFIEKWVEEWLSNQKVVGEIVKDKIHVFFANILLQLLHVKSDAKPSFEIQQLKDIKHRFSSPLYPESESCKKCKYPCLLIPLVKSLNSKENSNFKQFKNRETVKFNNTLYEQYTNDFLNTLPIKAEEFATQIFNCSEILSKQQNT